MTDTEQIAIYDPDAMLWWPGDLTPSADIGGGAIFGHFTSTIPDLPRLAVVYYPDGGHAFTTYDWHGVQPETPADIPLFTWRCGQVDALLLDGRPVMPPWAAWGATPPTAGELFSKLDRQAQTVLFDFLAALAELPDDQRQRILAATADELAQRLRQDDAGVQP